MLPKDKATGRSECTVRVDPSRTLSIPVRQNRFISSKYHIAHSETGCVQHKHPSPSEREKLAVLPGMSFTDAVGHQQCHRALCCCHSLFLHVFPHLLGCWPLVRSGFTLLAVSFFHFLMHIPCATRPLFSQLPLPITRAALHVFL